MNYILLVFIVPVILLSCNSIDNETAFKQVVSTQNFEDTVLFYQLYSDSIVFEFEKPPKMKHWRGEVFLVKNHRDDYINVHFPESENGYLGKIEIKTNKITLDGFHIPNDSIQLYTIRLRINPYFPGKRSISELFGPAFLFRTFHQSTNQLTLEKSIKDWTITSFDLVKMKNLPIEQREFCQDSIEKAYGLRITDVEIAESSYTM